MKIVIAGFLILFVLAYTALAPLALIWAADTLLALAIPTTKATWLAAFVVIALFGRGTYRSKS